MYREYEGNKTLKYKANLEIYSVSSTCDWLNLSFISKRQVFLEIRKTPTARGASSHNRWIKDTAEDGCWGSGAGWGAGGGGGGVAVLGRVTTRRQLSCQTLPYFPCAPNPNPLHCNTKNMQTINKAANTHMPQQLRQWGTIKHTPKQPAAFTQAHLTRPDKRVHTTQIRAVCDVIW